MVVPATKVSGTANSYTLSIGGGGGMTPFEGHAFGTYTSISEVTHEDLDNLLGDTQTNMENIFGVEGAQKYYVYDYGN